MVEHLRTLTSALGHAHQSLAVLWSGMTPVRRGQPGLDVDDETHDRWATYLQAAAAACVRLEEAAGWLPAFAVSVYRGDRAEWVGWIEDTLAALTLGTDPFRLASADVLAMLQRLGIQKHKIGRVLHYADGGGGAPPREASGWQARCGGKLLCSPDCGTVRAGQETFVLSVNQRAVVRHMIDGTEGGRAEFTTKELMEVKGTGDGTVRDLFRNGDGAPVWGGLVIAVEGRKGMYRLRLG